MNNFDAMNRQYPVPKMKEGTYPFARNIILTNKYTSVMNEHGAKNIYNVPGIVIGEIVTSSHIVYFSTDLEFSYIGYVNLSANQKEYTNIVKSIYFNFQLDCPIEGIFYYNYKNELIVGWCDGIFENSNTPYLLNLIELPFALDGNNELLNKEDLNKARWFPFTKEPEITVNYFDNGDVQADSMHITMSYCLEDGTELFWFPIDVMAYPKIGLEEVTYRQVELLLENLDVFYEYYKVGFVINKEGASMGYKSELLTIRDYSKETHLIDTLNSYVETSVEELAFVNMTVNKVNTLTLESNQVFLGAFTTRESEEDNLQKYANKLNLSIRGCVLDDSNIATDIPFNIKTKFNHPSLLPNEVYAFKIKAKRLDGTYTDSFHISNNDVRDNSFLSPTELIEYGINNLERKDYKKYQVFNNSELQTKIDNNNHIYKPGTYLGNEVYPDVSDFDSTTVGGEDLRGQSTRYHRMPSIRTISLARNTGELSNIATDSLPYLLFPYITNLEDVFPTEVLDKYQSFTLEIVKRTKSNCVIQDTGVLVKHVMMSNNEKDVETISHSAFLGQMFNRENISNYKSQMGYSAYFSNLSVNKRLAFTRESLIEVQGIANTNQQFVDYYKDIDLELSVYYAGIQEKYFVPETALTLPKARFGVLKNYKYYEENRSTNNTRFAPNQCLFNIDSSNKGNTVTWNRFNPLNSGDFTTATGINAVNVYDDIKITYVIPFGGEVNRVIYNRAFLTAQAFAPAKKKTIYMSLLAMPSEAYVSIVDIVNINSNLYKLKESNLITIGKIFKGKSTKFVIGGDVFINTRLEILDSAYEQRVFVSDIRDYVRRSPIVINNLYSTANNSIVKSDTDTIFFTGENLYGSPEIKRYARYNLKKEASLNILNTVDFKAKSFTTIEGDSSRLNDLVASISVEESRDKFINRFPYRVLKSNVIQKESLTSRNIRVFKTDAYYDMPSDKGLIVALRSNSRRLYIQQKYSLSVSEVNATMNTNTDETVYLGQSLFLDRPPMEIMENDNLGYIGCQSKFACKIFRDGLIIIDMLQGKIFILSDSIKEVSTQLMRSYYKEALKIHQTNERYVELGLDVIDNPFLGIGFTVCFDNEYERIIFTKQHYELKEGVDVSNYDFNGEVYISKTDKKLLPFNKDFFINKSETFSIATETLGTISNHDYFPNSYIFTNNGLFYTKLDTFQQETKVFEMNSKLVPQGEHGDTIVESYIDIPFNKRLDLSKLYQSIYWITEVVDRNGVNLQYETIDKVLLYNYNQCSGYVKIEPTTFNNTRNNEGIWQFNEFRDLLKDVSLPIIYSDGQFNEANINNNKYYFNKSNFIGIFMVVRVYFKNGLNKTTYLHNINVKSIISKR